MNRTKIDRQIENAYKAIDICDLLENGKIDPAYRGQIASFGAAVRTGSLLAAIAFFSQDQNSKVQRSTLIQCINYILFNQPPQSEDTLFKQVKNQTNKQKIKKDILNAAVALKLAINLYPWKEEGESENENKNKGEPDREKR